MDGIKNGIYKFTYSARRSEQEILSIIERKKVKLFEDDLKVISEDSFRKIRGAKELTLPSKINI